MKKGIPYNQGKRSKTKTKKNTKLKKRLLIILTISIIVIPLVCFGLKHFNSKASTEDTKEDNEVIDTVQIEESPVEEESTEDKDETVEVDLPDQIGGYKVIGKLVIEKLGIDKPILNKTDNNSLNLSVTKFYGPNVNEVGNFCITGHNYANLLKPILKGLDKGDTFYLINKETKTKVTYKVFDKYTCKPTDLECLDSRYPKEKEVTLITCNPGGTTRMIIKAKQA